MRTAALVAVVSLACAAGSAVGDIAYSNLLPGQTTVNGALYSSALLTNYGPNPELGYRFTAAASGGITQIRAGLFRTSGVGALSLALYSYAGGPGSLLAEWDVNVPLGFGGSPLSVITLDGQTTLSAGSEYVLSARTPDGRPSWMWFAAGTSGDLINGDQYFRTGGGAWALETQPMTAFEITVVPAPSTLLAGLAAVAVATTRRRR